MSVNVTGFVWIRLPDRGHLLVDRSEELGHDDDFFPGNVVDLGGLTEDAFGLAVGVRIGGIEGVDSVIEAIDGR